MKRKYLLIIVFLFFNSCTKTNSETELKEASDNVSNNNLDKDSLTFYLTEPLEKKPIDSSQIKVTPHKKLKKLKENEFYLGPVPK